MPRLVIPRLLLMIAGMTGCAAQSATPCAPGTGTSVEIFTLFMGKAIPGRDDLTDKEWQTFLDTTVTANLPDGYTVFDANGGWMNRVTHKTVREGTKVLLVALPEAPDSLAAINRIRNAYQVKFRQQLVGMTVERACGTF
jgi:Protein of unknown function (DUF3574)